METAVNVEKGVCAYVRFAYMDLGVAYAGILLSGLVPPLRTASYHACKVQVLLPYINRVYSC